METTETTTQIPDTNTESFAPSTFGSALKSEPASSPEISQPEIAAPAPRETPSEIKTEAPVLDEAHKEREGLKSGMIAERRKRQEAEAEVARLKASITPQQAPEIPNFYQDPENFTKAVVETSQKKFENQILSMSEQMARSSHPDYDEKYQAFEEAARQNPVILQQILASPNPAEAAYNLGKVAVFGKKYGMDEDSIRTNIRKEIEADVRKEIEAQVYGRVKQKQNLPTSLSQARAANGAYEPEYRSPSFAEVLKGR